MNIEALEAKKRDNALKAKEILSSEEGIIEDAQKLLDEAKLIFTTANKE